MRSSKRAHIFFFVWLAWQFTTPFLYAYFNVTSFIAMQITGFFAPFIFACFCARKDGFALINAKKPDAVLLGLTISIALLIQPLGMFISFMSSLVGFDSAATDTITSLSNSGGLLIGLISLAVLPAVTEELVCRGVILSGYQDIPPVKAALLNGIIFGFMHMNLRQFFYAFTMGYVIALVVIRAGSVIYGIAAHFIINGTQFFISRIPQPAVQAETSAGPVNGSAVIITAALALLIVAAFTWASHKVYLRFKARCAVLDPEYAAAPREGNVHIWTLAALVLIGVLCMLFT